MSGDWRRDTGLRRSSPPGLALVVMAGWLAAVAAHATGPIELTTVLQNGPDYEWASDSADGRQFKLAMNRKQGTSSQAVLRFSRLDEVIRGEGIEVLDARLELFYADETWTYIRYHVAAAAVGTGETIEGRAVIAGDKWPGGVKTPLRSWISIPLRPGTIQRWIQDEGANSGLVLWLESARVGQDQVPVPLKRASGDIGGSFVAFQANAAPPSERPRLVVRYRVGGNASPSAPRPPAASQGALLASPAEVAWEASSDPNPSDRIHYEFQAGRLADGRWTPAGASRETDDPRLAWDLDRDIESLYGRTPAQETDRPIWYRVRSVDSRGGSSGWRISGPYRPTHRPLSAWMLDGNRKAWRDAPVPSAAAPPLRIRAARNEWESFQVVVAGHAALRQLAVQPSALKHASGATLPAPTTYRQHYIPIDETANTTWGKVGMVPDALVPLVHPLTGRPTGGRYGGNRFEVAAGAREAFWMDTFVPADAPPGLYRGTVTVSAEGVPTQVLEVELEVWDFQLGAPKKLAACFQLDDRSVRMSHQIKGGNRSLQAGRELTHHYEVMLHDHYISNWSPITGFNYALNGVEVSVKDGLVTLDWTGFDALVGPYMDGSAFADGVPSQCLFVPYWLPTPKNKGEGWAERVNQHNYRNVRYDLFAQFIRQVQEHLRQKGWMDRAYVFYFDEPFISNWKYEAFINTAKVIRREAPDLRILLSDGYRGPDGYKGKQYITEPIEKYVDVWDPVTFQVSSPELAQYYRDRRKAGHFDMWCQTLANANPNRAVINLFPEFDMPFHRMWGVISWNFGFQAIEWWQTIIWWDERAKQRIDPWTDATAFPGFRKPLNGDGRLFYPGTEADIGGPDIPISSLRMKALREAIEDYEYLHLLEQSGRSRSFALDRLHTLDDGRAAAMREAMPMGKGPWQWWEGDPDAFMAARADIARLIIGNR